MDDYIDKIAVPQVSEILTHYGEFPAVLWWDTPVDMNQERAEKLLPLLRLKPGIIHNNRLGGVLVYGIPEGRWGDALLLREYLKELWDQGYVEFAPEYDEEKRNA
jgi:hypothetical protein